MPLQPQKAFTERHDVISVLPGAPGAGNPMNWPCPDNHVVQIVGFSVRLTTDATVADRLLFSLVHTSLANLTLYNTAPAVQPASVQWTYYFSVGVTPADWSAAFLHQISNLPCCMQLKHVVGAIDNLRISVVNLQAADVLDQIVLRMFDWQED
jgi:hypothetical protein